MKSLLATFGVVSILLIAAVARLAVLALGLLASLGVAGVGASHDESVSRDLQVLPVGATVAAVAVMELLGRGAQRPPETASR